MAANSIFRKIFKTVLRPLTGDRTYKYIQAYSKSRDIRSGAWSEPELDLVRVGIRSGDTALDIGANFGVYSHHMGKAVGVNGHVYSFEPIPFTFETFVIVGKLLNFPKSVELINKGCGNENIRVSFTVPVQNSGALSTGQAHLGQRDNDRDGREQHLPWTSLKTIEADIVRLDDHLPEISDLSFIKADIEGAEMFAFRGGERLISEHLPTVVSEINPWFLEGFGIKLDELLEFFFSKGYKLYFYSNGSGKGTLREVAAGEIVEDNYVFIHPSRSERFSAFLT